MSSQILSRATFPASMRRSDSAATDTVPSWSACDPRWAPLQISIVCPGAASPSKPAPPMAAQPSSTQSMKQRTSQIPSAAQKPRCTRTQASPAEFPIATPVHSRSSSLPPRAFAVWQTQATTQSSKCQARSMQLFPEYSCLRLCPKSVSSPKFGDGADSASAHVI